MLGLLIGGCALLGLVVGSFLNVVIYRVPRHQSIAHPRSACPNCTTTLRAYDNIPVVSWLVLRGHCRTCRTPIAVRYPAVELLTAILFAGAAWRFGFAGDLVAFLFLLAGLVALSWIDAEHLLLPRVIVYPLLGAVGASLLVTAATTHQWHRLMVAALCALAWFALFFVLNLVNPRWMGLGDARLSLVLGLALGWLGVGEVIVGFFLANLIGAVLGLALIGLKLMRRDQQIPYGVYLSIGAVVSIFFGHWLLAPFAHLN